MCHGEASVDSLYLCSIADAGHVFDCKEVEELWKQPEEVRNRSEGHGSANRRRVSLDERVVPVGERSEGQIASLAWRVASFSKQM